MPEDKLKILYDAVSKDYDIGTYNDFSTKLNDPEKRKAFYNGVGSEYQLGTFDEFSSKLSPVQKKSSDVTIPKYPIISEHFGFGSKSAPQALETLNSESTLEAPKLGSVSNERILKDNTSTPNPILQQNFKPAKEIISRPEHEPNIVEAGLTGLTTGTAKLVSGTLGFQKSFMNQVIDPIVEQLTVGGQPGAAIQPSAVTQQKVQKKIDDIHGFITGVNPLFKTLEGASEKTKAYANKVLQGNKSLENKTISGEMEKGNYNNAAKLLAAGISEFAPMLLSFHTNPSVTTGALWSQNMQTLDERQDLSPTQKSEIAGALSLIQTVAIPMGASGITSAFSGMAKKLGPEAATKKLAETYFQTFVRSSKQVLTPTVRNAAIGMSMDMASQVAEIALDPARKDDELDLNRIYDSGMVFAVPAAAAHLSANIHHGISEPKTRKTVKADEEKINSIKNDLQNPEVSEPTKEILAQQHEELVQKVNDHVISEIDKVQELPQESQAKIADNTQKINALEHSIENEPLENKDAVQKVVDDLYKENEQLKKEGKNAIKKRNEQKSNQPEHQNRDESGQATETSSSDSNEQSGEGQKEKVELAPEEKSNLENIAKEAGVNFQEVRNVYNKHGEGKPLGEITKEDYLKAQEKRQAEKTSDNVTITENDILNKDNSINLPKVQEYAKRIEKGDTRLDRLSQEEERGRSQGGRRNVEASILVGANDPTTGKTQSPKQQIETLTDYAKKEGIWTDNPDVFGEEFDRGSEAQVYDNKDGSVTKVIALNYFAEDARDFLDRISLNNHLFPDTKITVEGFGKNDKGDFSVVVKQPFIKSEQKATRDQIMADMESLGYKKTGKDKYANREHVIEDLTPENVLVSKGGSLLYIDPRISINTKEFGGGNRIRGEGKLMPETKLTKKEVAGEKIDAMAQALKDFLPKADLPEGTKKSGYTQDDVIDMMAKAVKYLVNTGIDIADAVKQVREKLGDLLKDMEVKDEDIKSRLADAYTAEAESAKTTTKKTEFKQKAEQIKLDINIEDLPEGPEKKQKKFLQTVKDSPETTAEMNEQVKELDQFYEAINNKDSIAAADKKISEDPEGAKDEVINNKVPVSAEKSAVAVRLIKHFENLKQFGSAIEVLNAYDKQLREAGRFIQAASLWNKLAPETIVRQALKIKPDLPKDVQEIILKKMTAIDAMPDGVEKQKATLEMLNFIADQIPVTKWEMLDAYRYQNMLSNPQSHLRNIYGNFFNVFLTEPMKIGTQATYDMFNNIDNPAAREAKFSQIPKYYKTIFSNLPNAFSSASEAFSNGYITDKILDLPNAENMIEALRRTKIPKSLTVAMRALEAQDRFFTILIAQGEKARLMESGIPESVATERATKLAAEYLYRDRLDPSDASKASLVRALDSFGQGLNKARKMKVIGKPLGWFIPFVTTPVNVAKMGVKFSPLGFIGGEHSKGQIAQASIGTMFLGLGATLAMQGNTNWSAPDDKKERELFYASGRKPFTFRVGDKWIPMQYLGPFALSVALPAAVRQYYVDKGTAPTDEEVSKLTHVILGAGQYMMAQTPLSGLQSGVDLIQGKEEATTSKVLAQLTKQSIPLSGLVGYVNKFMDPVYRKSKGYAETIQSGIPGMSQGLEAYEKPGIGNFKPKEESKRETVNNFLPYEAGFTDKDYEILLKNRRELVHKRAINKKQKVKK